MSQKDSEIGELLLWAKSNQTYLHPNVEVYKDAITGLSFKAAKDILPGTNFVNCSYKTTLSYLNAIQISSEFQRHDSQLFPSEFIEAMTPDDPNIIGHFFLMKQYLMGKKSYWWDYIKLLPQPDQAEKLALPIWWPEADRKFLTGTNAEPPILKRQELWKGEWRRGIALLKNQVDDWEDYEYPLYQWAATIFGTRSFRASLTIPEEILEQSPFAEDKDLIIDHIKRDRFSVLLPVLDIGNHNGVNDVAWVKDPKADQFSLRTLNGVELGSQVFNFYGYKSNSELLVGYGFILPNLEFDTVNLKLTPPAEAMQLRRSQKSHIFLDTSQPEEEFMFKVRRQASNGMANGGFVELDFFSGGLFDTTSCMVCNKRERQFIIEHPECSLESDTNVFEGPLARAVFVALRVLFDKLDYDFKRIREAGRILSEPKNGNQTMALDYRTRQLDVLKGALTPILNRLQSVASYSSFCQHPHHKNVPSYTEDCLREMHAAVELLSLECAFDWLQNHYPEIYTSVVTIVSEDQEEPLPLDWVVLVDDWDHTYWTVWIHLVWMLWARDGQAFQERHPNLSPWLVEMNANYLADDTFYAETSEQETINHTIWAIAALPQLETVREWLQAGTISSQGLRNFASYVAKEETIPARFNMGSVNGPVEQKMLVVSKRKASRQMSPDTTWSHLFSRNPGFSKTIAEYKSHDR